MVTQRIKVTSRLSYTCGTNCQKPFAIESLAPLDPQQQSAGHLNIIMGLGTNHSAVILLSIEAILAVL